MQSSAQKNPNNKKTAIRTFQTPIENQFSHRSTYDAPLSLKLSSRYRPPPLFRSAWNSCRASGKSLNATAKAPISTSVSGPKGALIESPPPADADGELLALACVCAAEAVVWTDAVNAECSAAAPERLALSTAEGDSGAGAWVGGGVWGSAPALRWRVGGVACALWGPTEEERWGSGGGAAKEAPPSERAVEGCVEWPRRLRGVRGVTTAQAKGSSASATMSWLCAVILLGGSPSAPPPPVLTPSGNEGREDGFVGGGR